MTKNLLVKEDKKQIDYYCGKPRKFFFHYNKHNNKVTVHFASACHIVSRLVISTEVYSVFKDKQPRFTMHGQWTRINYDKTNDSLWIF